MNKHDIVDQRRRDVSAYVSEHPMIGLDKPKLIADALGLKHTDVENDVKFLKDKLKEDYSQYSIGGLRDKAKAHVDRLKELQAEAKKVIDKKENTFATVNNNGQTVLMKDATILDIKLKAMDTELKLIHNIYKLEQDGIGALTEEINGLENKQNKKVEKSESD